MSGKIYNSLSAVLFGVCLSAIIVLSGAIITEGFSNDIKKRVIKGVVLSRRGKPEAEQILHDVRKDLRRILLNYDVRMGSKDFKRDEGFKELYEFVKIKFLLDNHEQKLEEIVSSNNKDLTEQINNFVEYIDQQEGPVKGGKDLNSHRSLINKYSIQLSDICSLKEGEQNRRIQNARKDIKRIEKEIGFKDQNSIFKSLNNGQKMDFARLVRIAGDLKQFQQKPNFRNWETALREKGYGTIKLEKLAKEHYISGDLHYVDSDNGQIESMAKGYVERHSSFVESIKDIFQNKGNNEDVRNDLQQMKSMDTTEFSLRLSRLRTMLNRYSYASFILQDFDNIQVANETLMAIFDRVKLVQSFDLQLMSVSLYKALLDQLVLSVIAPVKTNRSIKKYIRLLKNYNHLGTVRSGVKKQGLNIFKRYTKPQKNPLLTSPAIPGGRLFYLQQYKKILKVRSALIRKYPDNYNEWVTLKGHISKRYTDKFQIDLPDWVDITFNPEITYMALFQLFIDSEFNTMKTIFVNIATIRLHNIKLALYRYRSKYGKFPDHLSDLVPKYLEEIPADPFMENKKIVLRNGRIKSRGADQKLSDSEDSDDVSIEIRY